MKYFVQTAIISLLVFVTFSKGEEDDSNWTSDNDNDNDSDSDSETRYEDGLVSEMKEKEKYVQSCRERFNDTAEGNVTAWVIEGCRIQCVLEIAYKTRYSIFRGMRPLSRPETLDDGVKCYKDGQCLKGQCYRTDDIQQCQEQLKNATLSRILFTKCHTDCVAEDGQNTQINVRDGEPCGTWSWFMSARCVNGICEF